MADRVWPPWAVLLLIWAVFAVHGVDRSVVLVLLEPIRLAFGLGDAAVGLIAGLGYAVPFALAGIPLGALADRVRRTRLLAALIALWSSLTALAGLAPGFGWLLLARASVGAAEAGAPPAMLSILGDSFDARARPAALSLYFTAPFAGLMAGAALAGRISQAWGWRAALFAVGLPGLLLAALMLALPEPARGAMEPAPAGAAAGAGTIGAALRLIGRDPALRRLIAALVLAATLTLSIANWTPVLLQRVHLLSPARTGLLTALVIGLPGVAGSLAGGAIAARLGRGDPARLRRVCAAAVLAAVPLGFAAPLVGSTALAVTLLAVWSFILSAYIGPGWGLAIAAAPAPMRGTVLAAAVVLTNLIGAGLGPQAVGLLSELLTRLHDPAALRHALAAASLTGLAAGALFLRPAQGP